MEGLRIYVLISCIPLWSRRPRGALKQHIRWSVNQNLRKGRLIVFMPPLSCGTAEIILSHRSRLFPVLSFFFFFHFFFPLPTHLGFTAFCAQGSLPRCARWPTSPCSPEEACSRHTAPSRCESCCFLVPLYLCFFYPSAQLKAQLLLSCSAVLNTK